MFKFNKTMVAALVAGAIFSFNTVNAEEELIGSDEYRTACASCHGIGGKGDGNMAQFLNVKPTDLTMLAKNESSGDYPFLRVFQVIDGRAVISGHGDRAMPVWGDRYSRDAVKKYGIVGGETAIRARVLELVYYLQSIQQK